MYFQTSARQFKFVTEEKFIKALATCLYLLLLLHALVWARTVKAQGVNTGPYHLVKKIVLGGEGGWDYFAVDSSHRVFIARGAHLMVVNTGGEVVADIPGLKGSHALAFAPDLNLVFTSNGGAHSMSIIDLGTLKIVGNIDIPGRDTDAILYDPLTKRVFTFNGEDGHDASVIDPNLRKILGNIPLGGKPEFAQTDGLGHVFVNIEDKSLLREIDSKTLKVINSWPLAPCESPSGQAIDTAHKRLIIGCHNKMMAFVDYTSGRVVATVPIGQGVDANWFDSEIGMAFASCGDGTITVARQNSPDKYSVVQTIETQRGARTMALDRINHNIYAVTSEFGPVPAAATSDNPERRPPLVPNTFTLLIFSR